MTRTVRLFAVAYFKLEITYLSIDIKIEIRVAAEGYDFVVVALVVFAAVLFCCACNGISVKLSVVYARYWHSMV